MKLYADGDVKEKQSLAVKYRPENFDEFVGQGDVVKSLKSLLDRKDGIPKAFLFTGPTGCGKTTLAVIVARELGCAESGFEYYNSSRFRGIDTIREMNRTVMYLPLEGDIKVIVMDECHKLTNDAQNAFLALLENPPQHVYFLLCTTEKDKLLKTIQGRCADFKLDYLSRDQLIEILNWVLLEEGVTLPEKVINKIARISEGSARNAVRSLDKIIDLVDEGEMLRALEGTMFIDDETVLSVCRVLLDKGSFNVKWKVCSDFIQITQDPEKARRGFLTYFEKVLLSAKQGDDRVADVIGVFSEPLYNVGRPGLTLMLYTACRSLTEG